MTLLLECCTFSIIIKFIVNVHHVIFWGNVLSGVLDGGKLPC